MAIVMMTNKETPGAVRSDYWSKEGRDIYTVETHKGLVVGLREMNGYDDSDFYATVWNAETGAPEEIMYASTRGWTYPNGAAIDATPEVLAKYDAYNAARITEARAAAAARAAKTPAKGKAARTVRNVKGKNAIEADVTGTIFWVGEDKFARATVGGKALRVGFKADDGRKVFIPGNAVAVIEMEDA